MESLSRKIRINFQIYLNDIQIKNICYQFTFLVFTFLELVINEVRKEGCLVLW
jgi:hypothetical protein